MATLTTLTSTRTAANLEGATAEHNDEAPDVERQSQRNYNDDDNEPQR